MQVGSAADLARQSEPPGENEHKIAQQIFALGAHQVGTGDKDGVAVAACKIPRGRTHIWIRRTGLTKLDALKQLRAAVRKELRKRK